ncbi:MAG: SirB2 family protein [Kangiellaceae bacterium]|jgi:uncharacterized membrane protein SirB2|nr:SirB2 family protein [Kangiellaceae bacterium]
MEYYGLIKHIHVAVVSLAFVTLLVRGFWLITQSAMMQVKLVKILPHVLDTLLIISTVLLVIETKMYPFVVDFVTIKLFLFVAYIVVRVIAFKKAKTKQKQMVFLALSIAILLAMFAVAGIKPVVF